ncbi:MAG: RimJ/RimL family protein N-acetyltransferase [Myxococcota bacterium]|jgi:RimJ/RimL family protein N-acetyltransferase
MKGAAELADAYAELRLTTPRLIVRRAVEADRATLMAHEQNPAIMAEIRDPVPEDILAKRIGQSFAHWDATANAWVVFSIEHAANAQMIGVVAFRVVDYRAAQIEFGYRLHPDWQGQGLAYEATAAMVDHLVTFAAPHKLVAYCTVENGPSYRLMERLGMQREGVFREHCRLGGQWRDDCAYGLLTRNWVKA